MDWDEAMKLARRAMGWFAAAGGMFLLCRAQPARGLAPFAMALLAAALLAGRGVGPLLAGCGASLVGDFDWRLPLGALIAVAGGAVCAWAGLAEGFGRPGPEALRAYLAGRRLFSGEARPSTRARSPNGAPLAGPSLAGAAVLLPGLMLARGALWPSVAATASALAALAAEPFIAAAAAVRPTRRRLLEEERAGLFLIACALAAGLYRLCPPVSVAACSAMALLTCPRGALTGVGLGAALMLMGADIRLAMLLALGGAAAQLCSNLPKNLRAVSVCSALLAAALLLGVEPVTLALSGVSGLLVVAMPEEWERRLAGWTAWERGNEAGAVATTARRQSAEKLRRLGEALGDLAAGYAEAEAPPDEQALARRLRARLCEGCGGYAGCWMSEQGRGPRLVRQLVGEVTEKEGAAALEDGMPAEYARYCRRARLIPQRLQYILEDFSRNQTAQRQRTGENRRIEAGLSQARRLLSALAAAQERPVASRPRRPDRLAALLERSGLEVESAVELGDEWFVTLQRGRWTPELAREAAGILTGALREPFRPAGRQGRSMRFARASPLRAVTGAAWAPRDEGAPCGDSHIVRRLDDARLLAVLCDGMGSGEDAARESAVAVRLLASALRAGASCAAAVEAVNALLLSKSREDMFATADVAILRLDTGEAELVKLAACPTLILRGDGVERLEGGRLPLGILERVRPGVSRTRLEVGDALVMVSDGVMDALGCEGLAALLRESDGDMQALAERIIAAAEAGAGEYRDDMTALCVGLRANEGRAASPGRAAG